MKKQQPTRDGSPLSQCGWSASGKAEPGGKERRAMIGALFAHIMRARPRSRRVCNPLQSPSAPIPAGPSHA
jgi:hypothetical protein